MLKFFLNNTKKSDFPTQYRTITAKISHRGDLIKVSTGIKVQVKNFKSGKVVDCEESGVYNKRLAEIEVNINRYLAGGKVTRLGLKNCMNNKKDQSINPYFAEFVRETKKRDVGMSTVNWIIRTHNLLKPLNLNFDEIDYKLIPVVKKLLPELHNNTIATYLKRIRQFMLWAYRNGYHYQQHYKDMRISMVGTGVKDYLTKDDLQKIYNYEGDYLRKYVDALGLFCQVGMRHSEWCCINNITRIEGRGATVKSFQKKGKKTIEIPLNKIAYNYLKKYNFNFPVLKYSQTYNKYFKEIPKLLGIDKKITTHICRRTLATNLYLDKMPMHYIRLFTGHATDKQLLKYIQQTAGVTLSRFMEDYDEFNY